MKDIKLLESERQPVECWTRVMGYFRPVNGYNKGKKSEFNERKWFKEEKAKPRVFSEESVIVHAERGFRSGALNKVLYQ